MPYKNIAKDRAASAARQRRLKAAQVELGRVRRGYYATPTEHASLVEHLDLLRSSIRLGDIPVAAAADVLPEFAQDVPADCLSPTVSSSRRYGAPPKP